MPYFETRTYLRPVPQSNLDQLNETGIYKLTPEEAINRVASGLSSYDNRLDFFMNNQELFPNIRDDSDRLEQAFAEFNEESFEMLFPDPKRTDNRSAFVGLKLTYPEGSRRVCSERFRRVRIGSRAARDRGGRGKPDKQPFGQP